MYHYTYKIHYSDGKFYIGVRTSKCKPEEDVKYIGSSKYTPNHLFLKKEILQVFPTRQLAIEHEVALHAKYDIAKNPMFYNQAKQTSKKFDVTGTKQSTEHSQKISLALKGKKHTRERVEKAKKTKAERYAKLIASQGYVYRKSEEAKKKLSAKFKGRLNPRKNTKLTESVRNKEYQSRRKFSKVLNWINIETLKEEQGTIYDMAYKYAKDKKKPVAGFRGVFTGRLKSYLKWSLKRV